MTWPDDAEAVVRWIRAGFDGPDAEVDGLADVRVTAELDGTDLADLTIDATGVTLRPRPPSVDAAPAPAVAPEVIARRAGSVRSIRVLAAPVLVVDVPVSVDVDLRDVPIDWTEYAAPTEPRHPESARGIVLRDRGAGMQGSVSASLRTADAGPLVEKTMRAALAHSVIRIRRVRVDIHQNGDVLVVEVDAAARWRLLAASARARVELQVTADAVITVRDLRIGSRNPLVAAALRVARGRIRATVGRTIDVNELIADEGADVRVHSVRVRADRELRIDARLG